MSNFSEFKQKYKSSLKSMDTEETIDLMFYRPIGYAWATLCAKLGIVPNVITIASIFLGFAGGVLFYYSDMWLNVIGMFLIIWANSFDSADGQLARLTGNYSRLGRILDGLSGDFWFFAIYFAICFRENVTSAFFSMDGHHWIIWTVAIITGICHAKQAASADYYRQFHLFFLKGKDGSELDSVAQLDEQLSALSWKHNFWKKITLFFYRNYTANQEKMTPRMQRLRAVLKERFGEVASDEFRTAFRARSKPLMKYTNMLSFNTRIIALFVSLFLEMPWLYFAFELTVLNLMMIYMVCRHEIMCLRFTKQLENGAY
ncbi:MAG: CDP-alcohol phosphatidyltransferase family protein [Muribaculaceae bacterium]|jgi:hypothetical protein|nr:CDP-alcohol phosphatidyltransferase family protein [Muribaculaceae bacterium]